MANIYARRLISTMDPLADYQAVGGRPSKVKELLHLDPNRLKEEARIASAPTHSAALERFPRRPFTRPPPPEEQMAAPAAAPSSSERPSTAPSRRTAVDSTSASGRAAPVARPRTAPRLSAPADTGPHRKSRWSVKNMEPEPSTEPAAQGADDGVIEHHGSANTSAVNTVSLIAGWQSDAQNTRQIRDHAEHTTASLGQRVKSRTETDLVRQAPAWWNVPKPVLTASKSFDDRHHQRVTRANRFHFVCEKEPTSARRQKALRDELFEVRINRFVAPVVHREAPVATPIDAEVRDNGRRKRPPPGIPSSTKAELAPAAAKEEVVARPRVSLETSIWSRRKMWCDAKSFHDTVQIRQMRFAVDWQCALEQFGLAQVIARDYRFEGIDEFEDSDPGTNPKVAEVGAVLMQCADMLYLLFTWYATLGGSGFMTMSFSEWSSFVDDHELASKTFKFCKRSDLDEVFYSMTTKKELTRVGFLAALVHTAIARYVKSRQMKEVAEALHRLLLRDVFPRAKLDLITDPESFRGEFCYQAETCAVLSKHEGALRSIFSGIASGGGSTKLLGVEEWCRFLDGVGLLAQDCTQQHARLAFVWSRMAVVDGRSALGKLREMQIPFESFLEAICRVAVMKSLPMDDEVEGIGQKAGFWHAGGYMEWAKKSDATAFHDFVRKRATEWGKENRYQPMHRCVDHLISIIVYAMQRKPTGAKDELKRKDDLTLDDREVRLWKQNQQKLRAKQAAMRSILGVSAFLKSTGT